MSALDDAVEAFRRFGWHLTSCRVQDDPEENECDCGFHAAWDAVVIGASPTTLESSETA